MNKIVSFAPSRASSSGSTSKAAAPARKTKVGKKLDAGSLSLSFDDEPAPEPKTAKTVKPVTAKPVTVEQVAATPVVAKPVTAKPVTAKPVTAKPVTVKAIVTKTVAVKSVSKVAAPKPDPNKPTLKLEGTKVRAPKNLDMLYGAKTDERPNAPVETVTPKKRLNKDQREARKQLMKPDEGLMERLKRASHVPIVKAKSEPRGKGWRFLCGRCGNTSFFQVPAGLCDCGAIAIKD